MHCRNTKKQLTVSLLWYHYQTGVIFCQATFVGDGGGAYYGNFTVFHPFTLWYMNRPKQRCPRMQLSKATCAFVPGLFTVDYKSMVSQITDYRRKKKKLKFGNSPLVSFPFSSFCLFFFCKWPMNE